MEQGRSETQVLKQREAILLFFYFPSSACINLDLVQMLQEFQLLLEKKISCSCEINVSVPWLGGLGWDRQADVSLAALKQLHK